MQNTQKSMKTMSEHGFTQFELTQKLLQKLNNFKLTPTAKLVLLYLSSCYNPKHGEMFPKQRTIADKIGVSEASVIRAVSELHKEGLVISERKYTNRYVFTSRFLSSLGILDKKMQVESSQNESEETCNLQPQLIEPTIEPNKEPLQIEDYKILVSYAKEHRAKNIKAYVATLRRNGSNKKILQEYKQVSLRYQTGELKRLEAIKNEHSEEIPAEYFAKIREKLQNNCKMVDNSTPSCSPQGESGVNNKKASHP